MAYYDNCRFRGMNFAAVLLLLLLLLLLPFLTPARARSETGPAARHKPGWQLTFDEEFSGQTLSPRKWTCSRGIIPNRSDPLQYFQPSAVTLQGGLLQIKSEYWPSGDHQYTSGEIGTLDKFSQQYGRLETRCRFPTAPGTWSAVYLLPADDSWPPEIDVAEFIGRDPQTIYLTNHWVDGAGQHQQANKNWLAPAMDWSRWHTYAIEWQPHLIAWYIDGIQRGKIYGPVSDVPMYIRVNTSVGGNFAGPPASSAWPQTFQIDYIRMYRRRDGPHPIFGRVPHSVLSPEDEPAFTAPEPPPLEPAPSPEQPGQGGADVSGFLFDLVLVLLVWGWMRRRVSRQSAWTAALAAGVAASASSYLLFRVQIVHWGAWWIALPLLFAEGQGLLHTLGLQYTLWPRPALEVYGKPGQKQRPLFILIPTVNEGAAVLEPTVQGALAARARFQRAYPDAEVTVVVCNDGFVAGYPEWREVERMAGQLGVVCVTRPTGGGAKAGNIEFARQAVGAVGEALIVLFDADQIAGEEFLMQTIPPFADLSIGWVQTGQYYRNLENPVARWANDQQALFYRVLCPGKAALNSAFICGTNVAIRAAALDEIGGLPQDSVTEDFAASLLLHPRWRSLFLTDVLATGLGPMDLPSYFAQQGRWATGTLSTLRHQWRAIFLSTPGGLSLAQRVQYGLACTHYLSGLRDLIYLAAPFVFLLLGISAISGTDLPTFLSHFLPYYLLSQLAFWRVAWGKTTLRGIALSFSSFPVLLASLLLVIAGRRVRFAVTPKRQIRSRHGASLLGQILAGAGCMTGLMMAAASPEDRGPVLLSALWLLIMLLLLASVLWLGVRDRRRG